MIAFSAVILSTLGYMMARGAGPGATGHRRENFNYRIPPEWSPEMEASYSFRAYMTDISMWIMLTDLQPHQQCAAIIMRLGGAAREMARMVTPQEMVTGGVMNGVAVDPVTYLLGSLHARFAALEEESRLSSMTEMLAFARRPGETINALLARYETVRQRAAIEGQFVMSIEGCSLQVLRACNIQSQHLFTLLQPFAGRLPQNDQQFRDMCTQLRRFGHISENAPGNIATALQGPFRQARPGAYLAQQDQDGPWHAAQGTLARFNPGSSERTFFGEDAAESNPGSFWDSLLPQPYDGQDNEAFPTTDYGYQPISEQAYAAHAEMEEDDGTDTDTSSDDGLEEIPLPDTTQLSERDAAEQIYMAYRRAKRTWRRFTGKPVRRFRRAIKFQKRRHWKGKGKGRGKGKGNGFFWTNDDTLVYLKGKGKGHRSHTSGKGHGRRKNPKDRTGNVMRCRICESDEHFAARCPQKGSGKGHGSSTNDSFLGVALHGNRQVEVQPRPDSLWTAASSTDVPPWEDEQFSHYSSAQLFPVFFFEPDQEDQHDASSTQEPWDVSDMDPHHGVEQSPVSVVSRAQSDQLRQPNPDHGSLELYASPPDPAIEQPPPSPYVPTSEERADWARSEEMAYEDWCNSQGGPVEGRMGYHGGSSPWEMFAPDPDWIPPRSTDWDPPAGSSGVSDAATGPTSSDFFHGMAKSCTICQLGFQRDEMVCRVSCGHTFHTTCCNMLMHTSFPRQPYRTCRCPNCRGVSTLIAQWTYIDPDLFTQFVGEGRQAPNLLATTPSYTHTVEVPPPIPDTFSGMTMTAEYGVSPASYHIHTRLADGRPSLIVDPGSVGNLCGSAWAKEVAGAAFKNGQRPTYEKRPRPLRVSGVGSGAQQCTYDCNLPVALRRIDNKKIVVGHINTPTVGSSDLPGLLGLTALRRNRAVLDFNTLQLHFCGPGDYTLPASLPPGTDTFQCELAPSGHVVLPCCEYDYAPSPTEYSLTLVAQSTPPAQPAQQATRENIPPPPRFPPRLATTVAPNWSTVTPTFAVNPSPGTHRGEGHSS